MADLHINSQLPWMRTVLFLFFFFISSFQFHLCLGQLGPPRNVEVYFPPPNEPPPPSPPEYPPPPTSFPPPPSPLLSPESPPASPSSGRKIATAVAATAASTIFVAGLAFLLFWIVAKRKRQKIEAPLATVTSRAGGGGGAAAAMPMTVQPRNSYVRYQGEVKGFIVDENGLDVLYWRKLEKKNSSNKISNNSLRKEVLKSNINRSVERERLPEKRKIQEVPLLRGRSSTSHINDGIDHNQPEYDEDYDYYDNDNSNNGIIRVDDANNNDDNHHYLISAPKPLAAGSVLKDRPELRSSTRSSSSSIGPPPVSAPPTPPPPAVPFLSVAKKTAPPVPPPPPMKATAAPPPPPPPRPVAPPPPPPPKARSLNAAPRPPLHPPKAKAETEQGSGEGSSSGSSSQVKMKPLHWDKVNMVNAGHSMVWDKINSDSGSFRFDGDLMEALFGSVATNKKTHSGENSPTNTSNYPAEPKSKAQQPSQIFILDTRKSQNIAIILKSLYVSRKDVIDALLEGIGLSEETLERLSRIAPTEEEQSLILEYSGDPARLADAECFLFHILKAVPSAFTRLNAMLFRSNYGSEMAHLRDSVKILELACEELRSRGLFVKLLEAILKAGNRMNAGTSRGNAQAFNIITSLRKLSDVRSTDGKTTLLHFVVEEVVRSEGKRCVLLTRSSSSKAMAATAFNNVAEQDREKEYMMFGLPLVGGLSSEFANVKKAASIDFDAFSGTRPGLSKRAGEIKKMIVSQSVKGGFAREMELFMDSTEEELKSVGEEEARVLGLVAKTTEYYQPGYSKNRDAKALELFIVVKDFLVMVDQVCVEIARNIQKRKRVVNPNVVNNNGNNNNNKNDDSGSTSSKIRPERFGFKFPNLPENFMSSGRGSSDSDDDKLMPFH